MFFRRSKPTTLTRSPVLLHLHGFAVSGTYLLPTADQLASEFESYIPDLPGYGRSGKSSKPVTVATLAQQSIEFMDLLEITKAVLVGNSLGCMTAMELARTQPERVDRVVLCSPGRPVYEPIRKGIGQVIRNGILEPPKLTGIVIHDCVRFRLEDARTLYRSMITFPTFKRFLALSVPTLILQGSRDPLVSKESLSRSRSVNQRIKVSTIEGAAHALNYSHPIEASEAIREFIFDDEREHVIQAP